MCAVKSPLGVYTAHSWLLLVISASECEGPKFCYNVVWCHCCATPLIPSAYSSLFCLLISAE